MTLRLVMPILVTVFMLSFVGLFSEFLLASIFLRDVDTQTLGVGPVGHETAGENRLLRAVLRRCAARVPAGGPALPQLPAPARRRSDAGIGEVSGRPESSPTCLASPHHDGSALYVSNPCPALGETRHGPGPGAAARRTSPRCTCGPPPTPSSRFTDAAGRAHAPRRRRGGRHDLVCHNPVTNYRFILEGGPTAYAWLNGTGVHLRDVPDAADFRLMTYDAPPAWARRGRGLPDLPGPLRPLRGADSGTSRTGPSPPTGTSRSPRLRAGGHLSAAATAATSTASPSDWTTSPSLGANVVYLTPFFPARSNHRYDASSFDAGRPGARRRRGPGPSGRRGARARLRVLGDFTTNHTGDAHEWFVAAQQDPDAEERGYYFWEDGEYVAWLGVPSLPKLNYDSAAAAPPRLRGHRGCGAPLDHRRQPASTAGGSTWPT